MRTGLCSTMLLLTACDQTSLVGVPPTNGVADPSVVATSAGAVSLYNAAVARWAQVLMGTVTSRYTYVVNTGLFTDELMKVQGVAGISTDEHNDGSIASSILQDMNNAGVTDLHSLRNDARQAREALERYAPAIPTSYRAHTLAAEAYGIVYLAEWACSGVPLTTVSLDGNVTLTRGFTTQEMLAQAVTLFDSAITLGGDSVRFRYLAEVGKGRALLDLGRFADAAVAVGDVPTGFTYFLEFNGSTSMPGANAIGNRPQNVQVRDNEGGNGLSWSTDPRATIVTTPSVSGAMPVPGKYSVMNGVINAATANPNQSVRAADGLEARLIEAEAALATGDANWLAKLNLLRSTCLGTAACAPVPGLTTANLPATLTDQGSAGGNLDLVMRERAMWLYLTGHRQGDLRRMAHIYHRDPLTLWPVGIYLNPGFPPFIQAALDNGIVSYVNVFVVSTQPTIGSGEANFNPLYQGCYDLNP